MLPEQEGYTGWVVVQFAGNQIICGHVTPERQYGEKFLRVAMPNVHKRPEEIIIKHVPLELVTVMTETTQEEGRKFIAVNTGPPRPPQSEGPRLVQ